MNLVVPATPTLREYVAYGPRRALHVARTARVGFSMEAWSPPTPEEERELVTALATLVAARPTAAAIEAAVAAYKPSAPAGEAHAALFALCATRAAADAADAAAEVLREHTAQSAADAVHAAAYAVAAAAAERELSRELGELTGAKTAAELAAAATAAFEDAFGESLLVAEDDPRLATPAGRRAVMLAAASDAADRDRSARIFALDQAQATAGATVHPRYSCEWSGDLAALRADAERAMDRVRQGVVPLVPWEWVSGGPMLED